MGALIPLKAWMIRARSGGVGRTTTDEPARTRGSLRAGGDREDPRPVVLGVAELDAVAIDVDQRPAGPGPDEDHVPRAGRSVDSGGKGVAAAPAG